MSKLAGSSKSQTANEPDCFASFRWQDWWQPHPGADGSEKAPPCLNCAQCYSYPMSASHCKTPWASPFVISRGYAGLLQTLRTLLCPPLLSISSPSEKTHPSRERQPRGPSSIQVAGLQFRGEVLRLAPPLEICSFLTAFCNTRLAWRVRAEFGPRATRSQLPKAPVWLWAPVNVSMSAARRRMCSHVSAAMQGSSAGLMPASLTLAVRPGEGEERLGKEDGKGRVFAEMHKMGPLQPDFQSCTFKRHQLSCPSSRMFWNSAIAAESHTVGGRNDHFRKRKEKGEKDTDTSTFSTLT